MPADTASPLPRSQGPAIQMEPGDHRVTASWGRAPEARAYQEAQRQLIQQGRFEDAIQMDIDDITAKFGNKYNDAVLQMIDSLGNLQDQLADLLGNAK